jgi:hypothetical protein
MKLPGVLYGKLNGPAPDRLSRQKRPAPVKNKRIQARVDPTFRSAKPDDMAKMPIGPSYKTFTITFYYSQQFHYLKVMKVTRNYASPIYKVALSSAIAP